MIETSILAQQVYQVLRTDIIGGKYSQGAKLDIHALAAEFGVSRSPVKDAISQLVHEGLIEIVPRKGTYVTKINCEDFLELLDVRLMIELWTAQQAINTLSEYKMKYWNDLLKEMDSLILQKPFPFEQYSQCDMKFHRVLVEAAGNTRLVKLYDSLNAPAALARVVYHRSYESTIARHDDHTRMYEAVCKRDLSALLHTLESHIRSLQEESKNLWDDSFPSDSDN
ncbi:GntR family transcriptional regulator [Alicyclobacillus suci]|uniref:GntR family transcriptional regulator n=1 Tax=Alicyclobacillus suci TaxID=2816080 RepID=UPI0011BDDDC0|nr:GntR family transcriptional regulator [Alicyclobacillus suci]